MLTFWRSFAATVALWLLVALAHAGVPGAVTQTCTSTSDQANACITGTFTGTGQSSSILAWGPVNVAVYGSGGPNGNWNATVRIERSFDGGTTWIVAGVGGGGQQASYNTPNQDVSVVYTEPERGVLYRLNCTSYTSGTINYRMSTTGSAALTWSP